MIYHGTFFLEWIEGGRPVTFQQHTWTGTHIAGTVSGPGFTAVFRAVLQTPPLAA